MYIYVFLHCIHLLKLIKKFLNNRFQPVLLNGETSDWLAVKVGVLQGCISGPLFLH